MDLDRAVEDARQRLEPQVDPRRRPGRRFGALGLLRLAVFVPPIAVGAAFLEGPLDDRLDAHPRVGEPSARPSDVLAQREFHALRPVADDQVAPGLPYFSLITASWPPIVLAEPCSSRAVVVPPASAR